MAQGMTLKAARVLAQSALTWLALGLVPAVVCTAEDVGRLPLEAQRSTFLAAEAALKAGDQDHYLAMVAQLDGYPLLPYLHYRELIQGSGGLADEPVREFLATYPDSYLADRLRASWIRQLAAEGRWAEVVDTWRPDGSDELVCLYRQALLATGRGAEALADLEPLWLKADAVSDACTPVFDVWAVAGGLTPDLVWRRIAMVLGANRSKLAAAIGRYLPPDQMPFLSLWFKVASDPALAEDPETFAAPQPQRGELIALAVRRLAARSPQQAAQTWDLLRARYPIPPATVEATESAVGLALAEAGDAAGLDRLDAIPATTDNIDFQGRRLRAALNLCAWERVSAWVARMPDGEVKEDLWRYWQARAEEILGHPDQAEVLYGQAAGARSLWGFLAAERLGLPYALDPVPTPADPQRVARLRALPALARIAELKALERTANMRREWAKLIAGLGPEDLMAAAVIAQGMDWPDQAIRTLARSGYWDDLDLRFPLGYRGLVRAEAGASGLTDDWIYAVLREESIFDWGAGSSAGAIGLMQLMPATARQVASDTGRRTPSRGDLLDPATNIALGSGYLATMAGRYGGHPALATAAYNAGPERVDQWLPASPMPADLWIATIPYRETRGYVRRVLAYRVIYADRLGMCPVPLGVRLGAVGHQLAPAQHDVRPE
jgi:soluble lytic murein transglycosylase